MKIMKCKEAEIIMNSDDIIFQQFLTTGKAGHNI